MSLISRAIAAMHTSKTRKLEYVFCSYVMVLLTKDSKLGKLVNCVEHCRDWPDRRVRDHVVTTLSMLRNDLFSVSQFDQQ